MENASKCWVMFSCAALRGVCWPFQIVRVQAGHHSLCRTLWPDPGAFAVAGNHGERQVKCQRLAKHLAPNLFKNALHTLQVMEVSVIALSCLELGDSVAMSPVDRMRSLSLKLVSLGKIYAGTPRYFPLGKHSYPPIIMLSFPLVRIFQLAVYHFVNSNIISLPPCIIYVSMSLWSRTVGSCWCSRWLLNYPLSATSLFKLVLSAETTFHFLFILGTLHTCTECQMQYTFSSITTKLMSMQC